MICPWDQVFRTFLCDLTGNSCGSCLRGENLEWLGIVVCRGVFDAFDGAFAGSVGSSREGKQLELTMTKGTPKCPITQV